MKIAITNNIALNGGDAAILLGMIKVLKQRFGQDTQFIVSGQHPEVCAQLYPDIQWYTTLGCAANNTQYNHIRVVGRLLRTFKRYCYYTAAYLCRWNLFAYRLFLNKNDAKTLKVYAESDFIISSGGTYLIEPYGIISQYIDYRISVILGKPLIQYTQSMGPFIYEHTKKRLRWVFNHCQVILLRDKKSADYVLSLGLDSPSKVHVVPDAAFALGNIDDIVLRNNDSINKNGNVAISVREWSHVSNSIVMENYRKCIADVVTMLTEKGMVVHFISTCQAISDYTDDNKEVDAIMQFIPLENRRRVIKYDEHLPIERILRMLRHMDFIVATRLHMGILSLISGTPVFPIAYEFKTIELYHALGYANVDELEKLDSNSLCNSVNEFMKCYTSERRISVNREVVNYVQTAMNVANYIM